MNFLKWLFGGGEPAGYQNVGGAEFEKLIRDTPQAVIIDVRTMGEYATGHLQKSLNYDILSGVFKQKVASLDKSKTYFVYCRSGNRSGQAAKFLAKNGFTNIYNLSGGIGAWKGKIVR